MKSRQRLSLLKWLTREIRELKCSSASLIVQVIYIHILENYGNLSKSPAFFALDFKVLCDYWCKQVNHSLINTHNGIPGKKPPVDIRDFPAIKKHLDKYIVDLTRRSDKGRTPYNLRNCAYIDDFSLPKIFWGEISDKAKFCFDEKGENYCEATTFFMTGDISIYLLCYLNSKLAEFLFSKLATTTGIGTVRWKKYKILQLFVPYVGREIKEKIESLYTQFIETKDESLLTDIDNIIYSIFEFTEEQISIIENKPNDTKSKNPDSL